MGIYLWNNAPYNDHNAWAHDVFLTDPTKWQPAVPEKKSKSTLPPR